jgi:hypothetical protein
MKRGKTVSPTKQPRPEQRRDWLARLDKHGRRHKQIVTVGVREIARDEADDWMGRVDDKYQRTISDLIVSRYSSDMDEGSWVPGGAMIVFDAKGRLINGQHILTAFKRSDLQKLIIVWQINRHPEAYMAFDHCRKRTAKDTLKWNGVDNPGEIASAATVLWQYEQGFFGGTSYRGARGSDKFPTDAQVQAAVRHHPGLHKHLWKNPFRGKCFSLGALRAASYLLDCIDHTTAEKFFEMLIDGLNIPSRDHPIGALRRTFMDMAEGERMRNGETLARIFKAWNAYVQGQSITGQLLRKDEAFPEPLSPADLEPRHPKSAGAVH